MTEYRGDPRRCKMLVWVSGVPVAMLDTRTMALESSYSSSASIKTASPSTPCGSALSGATC